MRKNEESNEDAKKVSEVRISERLKLFNDLLIVLLPFHIAAIWYLYTNISSVETKVLMMSKVMKAMEHKMFPHGVPIDMDDVSKADQIKIRDVAKKMGFRLPATTDPVHDDLIPSLPQTPETKSQ